MVAGTLRGRHREVRKESVGRSRCRSTVDGERTWQVDESGVERFPHARFAEGARSKSVQVHAAQGDTCKLNLDSPRRVGRVTPSALHLAQLELTRMDRVCATPPSHSGQHCGTSAFLRNLTITHQSDCLLAW